jgi:hypothetical protein
MLEAGAALSICFESATGGNVHRMFRLDPLLGRVRDEDQDTFVGYRPNGFEIFGICNSSPVSESRAGPPLIVGGPCSFWSQK